MSDAHPPHGAPSSPQEPSASAYDLVREAQRRSLSSSEARALEAALADDAQLREFAASYPLAHRATLLVDSASAALARPDAWTRLEAQMHEPHAPTAPAETRRPVALRLATLLLAGAIGAGAWIAWRASSGDAAGEVLPPSIDVALVNAADAAELERALSQPVADFELLREYAPVRDGQIQWLASLDEGLALAQAADRPLLLFGMYTTCPWCIEMQAEGLRDATVLALAEEFVAVRIVYDNLAPDEVAKFHARGYPLFELWSPSGEIVHAFPGRFDAASFVEHLDHVSTAERRRSAPPWERVRNLAEQHQLALAAEREGRFSAAYAGFQGLLREQPTEAIAQAARAGLERIGLRAAFALREARSLEFEAARHALANAEAAFEATPFARDFSLVRAALEARRVFPTLQAPSAR